ncbi:MAG: hypothetical protein LBI26_02160 [Holosporales bacterium]|jgi:hypothetical protein|nr:hypothetical protein [Holosporales bacterium]
MNKKQLTYTLLVVGIVIAVSVVVWKTGYFGKITERQTVTKQVEEQKSEPENEIPSEEDKTEKKLEEESKKSTENSVKEDPKAVVKFKDGTMIKENEISEEMNKLPEQISSKMSLKDVKLFLSTKLAFDRILMKESKKEELLKDNKIKMELENKKNTVAGMMFLNDKAKTLMTDEALEKHYDKIWEDNLKDTKEYDIKAITTSDKLVADKIKKQAKNIESLNEVLDLNKDSVKAVDLDGMAEATLPVEIAGEVKNLGENALIGPIFVKETYMLFFVKKASKAKKQEFSGKFKEDYKKIAIRDFTDIVSEQLYKKYNVKFFGINGKEVDIKKENEKIKNRAKDNSVPAEQFDLKGLKENAILASIGKEKVSSEDIRKFFKLKSLQDSTFVTMAQQFNMSMSEILIHAAKLYIDDKICVIEAKMEGYFAKSEVLEKMAEIEQAELINAYLKKHVKISPEQVKKTYDEFIKSIPEEDKNDNEISAKAIFFASKDEASKLLEAIKAGRTKFNDAFKTKENNARKTSIDLKYVNKKIIDSGVWSILKKSAAGTCYKEILEIDGEKFGAPGMDYIIIYVGDKRPITLPSLSNKEEKQYFESMTRQKISTTVVLKLFQIYVSSVMNKSVAELIQDKVFIKMLEAMIAGNQF